MKSDVVVVGAGPSGSTCAWHLADKGFNVTVLEWKAMPRMKLCGGALSDEVFKLLGFKPDVKEYVDVNTVLFYSPSGNSYIFNYGESVGALIPRYRFDEQLVAKAVEAGASVYTGKQVTGVEWSREGVKVYCRDGSSYEADVVVGADGFSSVVSRDAGLTPEGWYERNAFCPVALIPKKYEEGEPQTEFYFGIFGEGYAWIFRHYDHLNVGIGTFRRNYKGNPRSMLISFMRENKVAAERVKGADFKRMEVYGAYIPYDGAKPKTYGDRVLLVGDAAGLVSTLTGEGIRYAIKSGIIAAEVLEDKLTSSELSEEHLKVYQDRCLEDPSIRRTLAFGRVIRDIMFSDLETLSKLVDLIGGDPEMKKMFVDLIFTRDGYRDLLLQMLPNIPMKLKLNIFRHAPAETVKLLAGVADPFFK